MPVALFLDTAVAVCKRYWRFALIGVLLLALLWFRHDAQTWRDRHNGLKTQYEAAQNEARAKQAAAIQSYEAEYERKAHAADLRAATAIADASRRAERFIAANRVQPAKGGGGQSPAQAEGHGTEGGNGPGAETFLVGVTAEDVRICTENTTRMEAVREWALGL